MSDGKYYWLKLQRDFFKRHDIRIVENMQNGKDYVNFYLKLLVESVDHEGRLRFSDILPYNTEMLAVITNTNVDIVRSALKVFCDLGMISILDDGTIFMTEVERMIGSAANNDNAKRQQRFRDNKKYGYLPDKTESVTKSNASVTVDVTEDNESKSKSKRKNKSIDINIVEEILDYLNQKANKQYRASTEKTKKLIQARFNEGFTIEDFKTVIDNKVRDWERKPDMNQYLRPETLFGTKFESYLNQGGGRPNVQQEQKKHNFFE